VNRKTCAKFSIIALLSTLFVSFSMTKVSASSQPLVPFYTVQGPYYASIDGMGTINSTGLIGINKPSASAVVTRAFFISSAKGGGASSPSPRATVAGVQVTYNQEVFGSVFSEVTSIIAPIMNETPSGVTNVTIGNANNAEGHILAVVFRDTSISTTNTVVLSFGKAANTGSKTTFNFTTPLNKQLGMSVIMSLGISYGFQGGTTDRTAKGSNTGQLSRVSLTTSSGITRYVTGSAGGADDCYPTNSSPTNGCLLTVGDFNDLVATPDDSTSATTLVSPGDRELYELFGLLPNGIESFTVNSVNPSNDDYLFFAGFNFTQIIVEAVDQSTGGTTPAISTVSPNSGGSAGGQTITITGTNLSNVNSVTFGGTAATIVSKTATSIVVTNPAGSGTVDVRVSGSNGSFTRYSGFTYEDAITPSSTLVITGTSPYTKGKTLTLISEANLTGKTTFYSKGRAITSCANMATVLIAGKHQATCTWKLAIHGVQDVYAIHRPTDTQYATTRSSTFWLNVAVRTSRP
jgi:hypothetical protein